MTPKSGFISLCAISILIPITALIVVYPALPRKSRESPLPPTQALQVATAQAAAPRQASTADLIRTAREFFVYLHTTSESLYDGDGHWGQKRFGYRMMLRDSYWRADVYGRLAGANDPQSALYGSRSDEVIDYLKRAQKEGGSGAFGAPADTKNPEFGRIFEKIMRACPSCIRNAWIMDLPRDKIPEMYYDHGYGLVSVVRAYERTGDSRLLAVIRAGADWSMDKPLTRNVNYLSAISKGLAYAYAATGERKYLDKAIEIHTKGIFPYQTEAGDWNDPHNVRLVYHGFITSALIALRKQVPGTDPVSAQLDKVLSLAVKRMAARGMSERASVEAAWPGTNALAWLELEELRALSQGEMAALERCVELMVRSRSAIEGLSGFRLQKALYSNFVVGWFVARK